MNALSKDHIDKDGASPSDDEVRDALARVVSSDTFASAPRLNQFLTYVVEKTIADRGAAIKGKAIAVDVYGRELRGESGQNLVRVEARRLRRTLQEYYADTGADDPWRIVIDLGGYRPRFESSAASAPPSRDVQSPAARSPFPMRAILTATVVLIVALAIRAGFVVGVDGPETGATINEAKRAAYRERSVQALQAVNLAEQARGMLFPVFDVRRQELALEMFRHSIDLDPGLPHGYAGSAQVLANITMLSSDTDMAFEHLNQADLMSEKALKLAATDPWAQGAKGWVLAVSGDLENALSFARMAVDLAPEDGHILDLAGTTGIVANAPQFAAEVSDPDRPRSGVGRFGANNIWGVSQLMLGNYNDVIIAFSIAPESGAPVSVPSLIFLVVAYDHVGETEKAGRLVAELKTSWPDFPTAQIIDRIFRNSPETSNDILERLGMYGYQ